MPDDTSIKPTLISSRHAYSGVLYQVRVDQVRLPSGRETVREVIEHPGAVAILAITEADQLIMVRQYRYPVGMSLLEIPAGTCEPNESAVETAGRELIEETGFEAGTLIELTTYYSSAGYSNERIHLVLATGCRRVSAEFAPDEVDEIALIPLSGARALFEPGRNQARDAKTLIALAMLLADLVPGVRVR